MGKRKFFNLLLAGVIAGMFSFAVEAQIVVSNMIIDTKLSDDGTEILSIRNQTLNGEYKIYGYDDDYELVAIKNGMKNGVTSIFSYEDELKAKGNYVNGLADGEWLFYMETERERLSYSYTYKNGKLNGVSKFYEMRSNPVKEETYLDGILTESREYFFNGSLQSSSFYKDGLRTGRWEVYHNEDKVLRSFTNYELNVKEGEYKVYFNNGKVARSGVYKNNNPIGEWTIYHDNGNVDCKQVLNKQGDKWDFQTFYENGKIKDKGVSLNFNLTQYDGKYVEYYDNGKTKKEENYVNGERNGKYSLFSENGKMIEDGMYNKGDRTEYRRYDENGKQL